MTLHLNDSSTWRQIKQVYVNDGGLWRTIKGVYVNDSGTWRQVYAAAQLTNHVITNNARAGLGGTASATFTLQSDGVAAFSKSPGSSGTYTDEFIPGSPITASGADYWARMTLISGVNPSGTMGSWVQLSSDRSWVLSVTNDAQNSTMTCEIAADAAGATIVTSATIDISVDSAP